VGATTRTGLLTGPLRDRFGISYRLDYYTPLELATIVRRSSTILGVDIDEQGAAEIASRSRGTPRLANRLLKRVRDYAQVKVAGAITWDVAAEALSFFEIDELGLDTMDVRILRALCSTFRGRPVGLTTIASVVGEDPSTLEDVYEPYLLQRGLIVRTPQGRQATPAAFRTSENPTASYRIAAGERGAPMLQRDYLLEIISQFVEAVMRAMRLAVEKSDPVACREIEQQVGDILELDPETALQLTPDSLVTMMVLSGMGDSVANYVAYATERLSMIYDAMGETDKGGSQASSGPGDRRVVRLRPQRASRGVRRVR